MANGQSLSLHEYVYSDSDTKTNTYTIHLSKRQDEDFNCKIIITASEAKWSGVLSGRHRPDRRKPALRPIPVSHSQVVKGCEP